MVIQRELLVESKEKGLLWSAVPALGIDPATESQEDMTTQVGYPGSPASLSGNSTEKAPSSGKGSKSVGNLEWPACRVALVWRQRKLSII